MGAYTFEHLRKDYEIKYEACSIPKEKVRSVSKAVTKILSQIEFYLEIERLIGVPWYVTGSVHIKECNARLNCQLANGEPWNRVTTLVPAGIGPWSGFVSSTIDILKKWKGVNWTIPMALYMCERHNGMGFRMKHPECNSNYLWSATSFQTLGGYPSDGKWDSNYKSRSVGVASIIKFINENTITPIRG